VLVSYKTLIHSRLHCRDREKSRSWIKTRNNMLEITAFNAVLWMSTAAACQYLDRAKDKPRNLWQTCNWKRSAMERKLWLFGHIRRMDNRKLKTPVFRVVEGTKKRGRPCRGWTDDAVSWCTTGLQELNSLSQDRRRWQLIVNGRWSGGSWGRRKVLLLHPSRSLRSKQPKVYFYMPHSLLVSHHYCTCNIVREGSN